MSGKARAAGKKTPPNTMNVRPFVYLRIPDVATGGVWQSPTALDGTMWGNIRLPENAIPLKCAKGEGLVELQSTYTAESTRTLVFEPNARIFILGNSLVYFDDNFKDDPKGSIEDYLDRKAARKT